MEDIEKEIRDWDRKVKELCDQSSALRKLREKTKNEKMAELLEEEEAQIDAQIHSAINAENRARVRLDRLETLMEEEKQFCRISDWKCSCGAKPIYGKGDSLYCERCMEDEVAKKMNEYKCPLDFLFA